MAVLPEDIERIAAHMNGCWLYEVQNEKIMIELDHPKSINIIMYKNGKPVLEKKLSGNSMWVEDYLWFYHEDSPYFLIDATENELIFGEFAQRGIIGPNKWLHVFHRIM